MSKWSAYGDDVVFSVCYCWSQGMSVTNVADWVQREKGVALNREQIYPLLVEGRRRGYLRVCPPEAEDLATRMRDLFGHGWAGGRSRRIKIVSTGAPRDPGPVASAAADTAFDVILEMWERKRSRPDEPVRVGLGAGYTTMAVAWHLAILLRSLGDKGPRIVFHALNSGYRVNDPMTAPVFYFSFFHEFGKEWPQFMALFAPPFVETRAYEQTIGWPNIKKAFADKAKIDVVITSLGSAADDHGQLTKLIKDYEQLGPDTHATLQQEGWVGDVQYRPYSATGPITADTEIRTVTLFELEEFVELSADAEKAVILVTGPCRDCNASREDALLPLLQEPSLLVWSHLVTSVEIAQACVNAVAPPEP